MSNVYGILTVNTEQTVLNIQDQFTCVFVDASQHANLTIELFSIAQSPKRMLIFKRMDNVDDHTITISPAGQDTISNGLTEINLFPNQITTILGKDDNNKWEILSVTNI